MNTRTQHQASKSPTLTGRSLKRAAIAAAVVAAISSAAMVAQSNASAAIGEAKNVIAPPGAPRSFADLVARVKPAVVSIAVETVRPGVTRVPNFQMDPSSPFADLFRQFFNQMPHQKGVQPGERVRAAGSGFIIDPDGYVITNNHVIEDADKISVVFNNGEKREAKLIGHDKKTDLALLKIDGDHLPYVEFGDSDTARAGDWVVAIGNPFGLGGTVTSGIVSARGRDIQSGPFDDFIQVDAPINRGNSGGPLFDGNGKVIGINTAIFSPNGGNIGIGFAIPANLAEPIIADLKDDGRITRGHLGVQVQSISPDLAESLGLDKPEGALVAGIQPDSPAAATGLQIGDVITEFGGEPIKSLRDLPRVVAQTKPGKQTGMTVWRNEKTLQFKVTVDQSDDTATEVAAADENVQGPGIGVWLKPLDPAARKNLQLPEDLRGALVAQVKPGSPADRVGLRPGDVIARVGNDRVTGPGDVSKAIRAAAKKHRKSVVLYVARGENRRFLAVPLV